MPRLHRRPGALAGAFQSRVLDVSVALLGVAVLPTGALDGVVLPDWATTPAPRSRRLADLSTSTTKWGTTKTTVTAPGTLDLGESVRLTKSEQPLPTEPWTPSSPGYQDGKCTSRFRPPPEPPAHATDLNGIKLPDTCFTGGGPHHVFVIGDWGGIFNGQNKPVVPADRRSKHMPSHHRPFVFGADDCAQRNVATQMRVRSLISKPDYVLNVGDNFYWGGVLVKCGGPPGAVNDPVGQWTWVYEKMYDGDGLADKQWLGVLGNHDFGGFLFTHGWDQAIGYTWSDTSTSTGRWVTPALYWQSKVHYPDFSIDYYFVDSNTFDAMHPDSDPGHNLCSRKHNLEVGATCGIIGPVSIEECPVWFRRLWDAQTQWLRNALDKSSADWQVVVTHFPPIRGWGDDVWKELSREFGIDIIIAGHVHRQEVHYMGPDNHMAPTAYIISGGGGGITSEDMPDSRGEDDQYGFIDLTLTPREILIEAVSHGGHLRRKTCVRPRLRGGDVAEHAQGPSLCDAPSPAPLPAATAATADTGTSPRQQAGSPAAAPPPPAPVLLPRPGPRAPAPGAPAGQAQAKNSRFTFVGFAGPMEARRACGSGKRLAMPKTPGAGHALMGAMSVAQGEGYMSTTWPENTIWLGGHWSSTAGRWRWDDGSSVETDNWAPDEPSSGEEQNREPWLCMLLTGQLCDNTPEYSFGVFCEPDVEVRPEDAATGNSSHAGAAPSADSAKGQADETSTASGTSTVDIMQDIAAAIEANSWNTVQVHTPLPAVADTASLHEFREKAVMQKDAPARLVGVARLLQQASAAKSHPLAISAVGALILVTAAHRPPLMQVAPACGCCARRRSGTPCCSGEVVLERVSRPLVPYAQLPSLLEPRGAEVA
uniref:C-type lectin domain-containing protein n=1 Tax=Alexandrium monilatum TaxID=311494 RepID=A0A7S4QF13_9DINO